MAPPSGTWDATGDDASHDHATDAEAGYATDAEASHATDAEARGGAEPRTTDPRAPRRGGTHAREGAAVPSTAAPQADAVPSAAPFRFRGEAHVWWSHPYACLRRYSALGFP